MFIQTELSLRAGRLCTVQLQAPASATMWMAHLWNFEKW